MDDRLKNKHWIILSLSSIPLIMTLGNSMMIPILPLLEKELNITSLQSSYVITAYSIVAIFLIPVAGFLSDRFGRKKIIIPALIITALGGLIAGLASWKMNEPYIIILLGRILQGVGASGAMPIVLPYVGDLFKSNDEASTVLGAIETSNTIGKVLSPILGSFLAGFIWFLPFFAIPLFCMISLVMVIFLVKTKESEEFITFKKYWAYMKEAFQEHYRWLIAVFIIGAILMFILFGFLFYLSTILEEKYHYDGIMKGVLLAIPLLALSLAALITGKVIKDHLVVMKWITFFGIVLTGASVAVIPFLDSLILLLGTFLVCGIGIGASLPSLDSLITKSMKKSVRGMITSIYSAMRFIGVALGPPLIAILMKQDIVWMASLLTVLALIAGILTFKNIKPETN